MSTHGLDRAGGGLLVYSYLLLGLLFVVTSHIQAHVYTHARTHTHTLTLVLVWVYSSSELALGGWECRLVIKHVFHNWGPLGSYPGTKKKVGKMLLLLYMRKVTDLATCHFTISQTGYHLSSMGYHFPDKCLNTTTMSSVLKPCLYFKIGDTPDLPSLKNECEICSQQVELYYCTLSHGNKNYVQVLTDTHPFWEP